MKLFQVMTSERATKSQGGNKVINTKIYIGSTKDSKHIATLMLNVVGEEVIMSLWDIDEGELIPRKVYPLDSKKQKGEICDDCGSNQIDGHCPDCWGGNTPTKE